MFAAAGAVAAVVTGLIAGEEVNVEGESRDMLMAHRNFVATVVASSMALWRVQHRKPNAVYLVVGAVGIGVVGYTAYLGGKIAPALGAGRVSAFLKAAGTDLVHGVQHIIQELGQGQFVPTIMAGFAKRRVASPLVKTETPASTG